MLPSYHPLQVSTFAVNYKGKPYMEGLSANKGLLITLGTMHVVRQLRHRRRRPHLRQPGRPLRLPRAGAAAYGGVTLGPYGAYGGRLLPLLALRQAAHQGLCLLTAGVHAARQIRGVQRR
eukprot:scaffold84244_cov37-Phaeocystis_antarctica.AAC.1